MSDSSLHDVGVVVIGRNEGKRLHHCFDSIPSGIGGIVYVDSASTDNSVDHAHERGIEVVALDMSIPFTAARARNAGLLRLYERWADVAFIQFIDGDCSLAAGWFTTAVRNLRAHPQVAMVFGRRREQFPNGSIYNRLCDMEWDTPIGEADSCGGDVLVRKKALLAVEGYDGKLIAGEEPELCIRLRAKGWKICRIPAEMTEHDADITRFGQWWKRTARSGHAYAEINAMYPQVWRRETLSVLIWALVFPFATIISAVFSGGLALILLLAYPALWLRISSRRVARGDSGRDAVLYATFCVLGKFPELAGMAKYWWNRGLGRRTALIEYK